MQLVLSESSIWVSNKSVDFRKSIDGLCATIMLEFSRNPQNGIYIFFNRNRDKIKILGWHRNGFTLVYKRLEKSKFTLPKYTDEIIELNNKQLSWLLAGLDWSSMSTWPELEFDSFY